MPKSLKENTNIKKHDRTDKVYCHESYAQELYDLMCGYETHVKDIQIGQSLRALDLKVLKSGEIEVHTDSGISLYLDMRKEKRYFEAFGIQDFSSEMFSEMSEAGWFKDLFETRNERVIVEGMKGSMRGSLYESHILNVRNEFFKQAKEQTSAYIAKVISKNQGGFFIKVQGIDAFLPGSLAAANKIVDFESYIGKEIPVMVEDYLANSDTFIFSYKKYLDKILPSKLAEIKRNSKHEGIITGTSKYGVFVEFQDIFTGLLHTSEMLPETLEKFNAREYKAGTAIDLWVKDIKDEKLILTEVDPSEKINELENFRSKIEGSIKSLKVISVKPFGVFCEIEENRVGLLPVKEMRKVKKRMEVGEFVNLCISKVDPETGKIYLSALNEKVANEV
jgi:ribosomal protein S1